MPLLYKLHKKNSKNASVNGKWYATAYMSQTTNTQTLMERIQRNCTAKKSDVAAVITELVEVIQDELQASHRVKIDGLGSFKIGISSTGAESAKKFTVADNVKSLHVVFQPETRYDRANKQRIKTFLSGTRLQEAGQYSVEEETEP